MTKKITFEHLKQKDFIEKYGWKIMKRPRDFEASYWFTDYDEKIKAKGKLLDRNLAFLTELLKKYHNEGSRVSVSMFTSPFVICVTRRQWSMLLSIEYGDKTFLEDSILKRMREFFDMSKRRKFWRRYV